MRALSYYPGVEQPLESVIVALASTGGATIATSRFSYWMAKQFPGLTYRSLPPLTVAELERAGFAEPETAIAASGGLAVHATHLDGDVHDQLVSALRPGGVLDAECRAGFSDLLHRARGYGACKAVLRVLAEEERLTLSEVARRLARTPGSTRDYLRWLEEVDLVVAREKRFSYVDPILRLWMRLHADGTPVDDSRIEREVSLHLDRAADPAPTEEFVYPETPAGDLVEID